MGFLRYPIKSGLEWIRENTFIQGGVVYTNTTFPIAFSSCLAIEVTAYGTANTQNNLRVTANSNTGFSCYTNDYTPRYLAVGY